MKNETTPTEGQNSDKLEAESALRDAACSLSSWRPIETAPKDGSECIIYSPEAGIIIAEWKTMAGKKIGQWEWEGGWESIMLFSDHYNAPKLDDVTHWMPLPNPPENVPAMASADTQTPKSNGQS